MMNPDEIMVTLIRALEQAGIHPRIIYAVKKTGRVITEDTAPSMTKEDLAEWESALKEYDRHQALREKRRARKR